jgi:DNA-directed RNA polymerase subunit E'/Rpb7
MVMDASGIKVLLSSTAALRTDAIFEVLFRLVVFRPFVSEVMFGKVKSSSEDGIRGQTTGSTQSILTDMGIQ